MVNLINPSQTGFSLHKLLLWSVVLMGCWAAGERSLLAQPPETPIPASNGATENPAPATPVIPVETPPTTMPVVPVVPQQIPQDILYLPDADGRLKPVPITATLEQYLNWLDQRQTASPEDLAEWTIRSLAVEGHQKIAANGVPWANLQFEMDIEVGQTSRWQSLPLMLGEGLLAGLTDSEEKNASSQLMVTRDVDSGQWLLWYRNRKSFRIELELLVPLRVTGEQNQLQLTLPIASRTSMELQLDRPDLQIELFSQGFWEKEMNEQGLLVRIAGFRQAVDLRWSPDRPNTEMAPIMHVDSQIELSRSNESVLISAHQKINLDRGALNSLRVKLPTGFQVDSVHSEIPIKYAIEATDPSLITLTFSQVVQTTLQIDWRLSSPVRQFDSRMVLEGFAVEGARTQTGKIGIVRSNEWRISQLPESSDNIYLINVRDFPLMGDYSMAFRYYGQPYRLALSTQRAESQFHHVTFYHLWVEEDQLKLRVDYEITPSNSVVNNIRLVWPRLNAGSWIPEKIIRQSTGVPIAWQVEKDDHMSLPLGALGDREVIRLEASCRIANVSQLIQQQESLSITLPRIASAESILQDRILQVSNSIFFPWEAHLKEEQSERFQLKALPSEWKERPLYQQKTKEDPRSFWYRLSFSDEPLELVFHPIEQTIEAESLVELEQIDLKNQMLTYTQQVQVQISQLPAEKIELVQQGLPSEQDLIRQRIRFSDAEGNELIPQTETLTPAADSEEQTAASQSTVYRFLFSPGNAVLGTYTIHVHRDLVLPGLSQLDETPLRLPLLQLSMVEAMPLQFRNRSAYQVTLPTQDWELLEASEQGQLWQQPRMSSPLELHAQLLKPRLDEGTGPVLADVNSWLDGKSQSVVTVMTFQMARTPPALVFSEFSGFNLISAYWQSARQAEAGLLQAVERTDQMILLSPNSAIGQPGQFVVSIRHLNTHSLNSLRSLQLQLPGHSLEQQLTHTRWTTNLPAGMYLFSPPTSMSPEYQWQWQTLGFRRLIPERLPTENSADSPQVGNHPVYRFSSIGWPDQLKMRLIGRGLMMTLGTGIPILIMALFAGRNYDFWLRAGLIIALLTLFAVVFFPEPFLVLLQPAILGTAFVLLATSIARRMKRHSEEPTLIIVGPNTDPDQKPNDGGNYPEHSIGADDITRVQPPHKMTWESSHP